jgi:FkbM family methyltransferase
MTYISLAQNLEDYRLFRALRSVSNGCYIDIGAWDPKYHSVSHNFYNQGWRGVNVEPSSSSFSKLMKQRPDEINLQKFVTNASNKVKLYVVPNSGLSTFNRDYLKPVEALPSVEILEELIETISLNQVFEQAQGDVIHWLKIDVEGAEGEVIKSWGENPTRPLIVVVEATIPSSPELSDHEWESELTSRGYVKSHFDGLNNFYCLEKDVEIQRLISKPISIFDEVIKYEEYQNRFFIQKVLDTQPDWEHKDVDDFLGQPVVEKFSQDVSSLFLKNSALSEDNYKLLKENQSLEAERKKINDEIIQVQNLKIFRYSNMARTIWYQILNLKQNRFIIGSLNHLAAFVIRRKKLKKIVFRVVPIKILFKLKMKLKHQNLAFEIKSQENSIQTHDPKLEELIELFKGIER